MKVLSIYKTEGVLELDYEKVFENLWSPLTELQKDCVGFVEVFDDVYKTTMIEGYSVFKVCQSVRKDVKPEALEAEFNYRIKQKADQSIQVDMDVLLNQVDDDLTRMADVVTKSYLVVYDHKGKRFLVNAERGKAEVCLHLMHNIFKEDDEGETPQFAVLMPEAFMTQPLLTSYIVDPDCIPEPLILGEMVKLGKKAIAGKAVSSANITIKNEDVSDKTVTNHLSTNKAVHALELDFDGIIYFNIDHTFKINGVKYDGSLKYKEDINLDDQDNFLAEYQQILPEISKMVDTLMSELDK